MTIEPERHDRRQRRSLIVLTAAIIASAGIAHAEQRTIADIGLSNSESARYDVAGDRWLVSNLGARGAGNDGFITVVDPDGKVVTPKWIAGGVDGVELRDPLGLIVP